MARALNMRFAQNALPNNARSYLAKRSKCEAGEMLEVRYFLHDFLRAPLALVVVHSGVGNVSFSSTSAYTERVQPRTEIKRDCELVLMSRDTETLRKVRNRKERKKKSCIKDVNANTSARASVARESARGRYRNTV